MKTAVLTVPSGVAKGQNYLMTNGVLVTNAGNSTQKMMLSNSPDYAAALANTALLSRNIKPPSGVTFFTDGTGKVYSYSDVSNPTPATDVVTQGGSGALTGSVTYLYTADPVLRRLTVQPQNVVNGVLTIFGAQPVVQYLTLYDLPPIAPSDTASQSGILQTASNVATDAQAALSSTGGTMAFVQKYWPYIVGAFLIKKVLR